VRASDALVDKLREERRGDQELTPLGVKRRGRLGGDDLVEGATLLPFSFTTFARLATSMSRKDVSSVLLLTELAWPGMLWPGMTIVLSLTPPTFDSAC
jgi:hypothetical protein